MRLFGVPLAIVLLTYGLVGCTYDSKEALNPDPCAPVEVSFQNDLVQYLRSYECTGCHNDQFANGGVNLIDYDGVKEQVDRGILLQVLRHEEGVEPMPLGAEAMNPCDIRKFESWIAEGAPNN